jgi:hypothetical protein
MWAVLALGAVVRLAVWQQARSLYLDEANLLRNFAERSYAGLWRPLDYAQYAPPLFSTLMKATTSTFGYGERAVRLIPLLASLASLSVFGLLARRRLLPLAAALAAGFFAFGSIYLDFATAAKQYSSDVLVALLLLLAADHQLRQPRLTSSAALLLALGGATAVWASMPAVFGLVGLGAALTWQYRRQLLGRPGGLLALVGVSWLLSFGAYFWLLLRADAQTSQLQQYHSEYFMPLPPHSAADWTLLGQQLRGLADRAFGKTALALVLAALGTLAGAAYLFRRSPAWALVLLVPLLGALGASGLHYYSLIPRLMLFAMPPLLLLIFSGLQLGLRQVAGGIGVLIAVVATLGNQQRLSALWQPFQTDYADVRAGLRFVAAQQKPGELLVVGHNVAPVAYHYQRLTPLNPPLGRVWLEPYRWVGSDTALLRQDIQALTAAGHRHQWLVTNEPDPWLLHWAAAHGTVSEVRHFYRGYSFRYEAR